MKELADISVFNGWFSGKQKTNGYGNVVPLSMYPGTDHVSMAGEAVIDEEGLRREWQEGVSERRKQWEERENEEFERNLQRKNSDVLKKNLLNLLATANHHAQLLEATGIHLRKDIDALWQSLQGIGGRKARKFITTNDLSSCIRRRLEQVEDSLEQLRLAANHPTAGWLKQEENQTPADNQEGPHPGLRDMVGA